MPVKEICMDSFHIDDKKSNILFENITKNNLISLYDYALKFLCRQKQLIYLISILTFSESFYHLRIKI